MVRESPRNRFPVCPAAPAGGRGRFRTLIIGGVWCRTWRTSRCSPSGRAGIAIGKAAIIVTVRVPSDTRKGRRQEETGQFGTTRRELLAMADRLRSWQVERAGMEVRSPPASHSPSASTPAHRTRIRQATSTRLRRELPTRIALAKPRKGSHQQPKPHDGKLRPRQALRNLSEPNDEYSYPVGDHGFRKGGSAEQLVL